MHIANDLYDVYGEILLKKDEEITPFVVNRIRKKGEKHKQVRVPLKNSDVFSDFEKVFGDERYTTMLAPPVSKKEICDAAGKLKIENDLIFELENMKNNLPYTYSHVLIVAAFVIKLALILRRNVYDMEVVTHCGFTHDIGKTRIPISILEKKEPLTAEEFAVIKTHPVTGYLLLNYYLKRDRLECSLASLEHHERLDGSGYPKGIRRIDKYTQLISPVDIMDALLSKRPYRDTIFSLRAVLDYLIKEADANRINKRVALALISFARKEKPDIEGIKISNEIRDNLPEEIRHEKYA